MRSTHRLTIPISKRVVEEGPPLADGTPSWRTWKSVPAGTRSGDVTLDIDFDAVLRDVGARALRNRSRRAVGLNGRIVARAHNVTEEEA